MSNPSRLSRTVNRIIFILAVLHLMTACTGIRYTTPRPQLPHFPSMLTCDEKAQGLDREVSLNEPATPEVLCRHILYAKLHRERNIAIVDHTKDVPDPLGETEIRIRCLLESWGYHPKLQGITVPRPKQHDEIVTHNIEVEIPGKDHKDEIVVIGAHYDSAIGSHGANDNGTGVAATLELARRFKSLDSFQPDRTVRFVFFTNEEEPYFDPHKPENEYMGSRYYAKMAKQKGENIVVMMSLETMGHYSDQVGLQCLVPAMQPDCPKRSLYACENKWLCAFNNHDCPDCQPQVETNSTGHKVPKCWVSAAGKLSPILWLFGIYQPKADFIMFAGNLSSEKWVNRAVERFRQSSSTRHCSDSVNCGLPAEGIYSWWDLIPGVNWSDHRSFWEQGYRAMMVTDTAPSRDYSYHRLKDDVGEIQFEYLDMVVNGLFDVVREQLHNPG